MARSMALTNKLVEKLVVPLVVGMILIVLNSQYQMWRQGADRVRQNGTLASAAAQLGRAAASADEAVHAVQELGQDIGRLTY